MQAPSIPRRIFAFLLAAVLLTLSAGIAWATVLEYESRGTIAAGVTLAGADLGYMTEQEVRDAIAEQIHAPLTQPVQITADDLSFTYEPGDSVKVDVDAMVDQAFDAKRRASFAARLAHQFVGTRLASEVVPIFSVDEAAVRAWCAQAASEFNRKPRDASVRVEGSRVVLTKSLYGRTLKTEELAQSIIAVLTDGDVIESAQRDVVQARFKTKKAKVTEDSFAKTILVDLSERRIRLFDKGELEKVYPCAIGTPGFPTPTGEYEITLKRYMPTWVNPGSAWAKTMPPFIPPGPNNPLGTRALNISAPGIRFHGTNQIYSVGTAASHGCMRMYRSHIEDLYERVEVGTKVFIVP